eukprot:TRINITY_DN9226_c0_g1_i3.p1 TRINITY_DN9226_c0_g1~~TRINITY_DN9226_c0_g1_i3.p1  ORF type:complete len:526 (+),score=135.76 TRINITY_DN9226_c0_g1_i3:61-1638(+)
MCIRDSNGYEQVIEEMRVMAESGTKLVEELKKKVKDLSNENFELLEKVRAATESGTSSMQKRRTSVLFDAMLAGSMHQQGQVAVSFEGNRRRSSILQPPTSNSFAGKLLNEEERNRFELEQLRQENKQLELELVQIKDGAIHTLLEKDTEIESLREKIRALDKEVTERTTQRLMQAGGQDLFVEAMRQEIARLLDRNEMIKEEHDREKAQLERKLEEMIRAYELEVAEGERRVATLQDEVNNKIKEVEQLTSELEGRREDDYQKEIHKLEKLHAETERELNEARRELKEREAQLNSTDNGFLLFSPANGRSNLKTVSSPLAMSFEKQMMEMRKSLEDDIRFRNKLIEDLERERDEKDRRVVALEEEVKARSIMNEEMRQKVDSLEETKRKLLEQMEMFHIEQEERIAELQRRHKEEKDKIRLENDQHHQIQDEVGHSRQFSQEGLMKELQEQGEALDFFGFSKRSSIVLGPASLNSFVAEDIVRGSRDETEELRRQKTVIEEKLVILEKTVREKDAELLHPCTLR